MMRRWFGSFPAGRALLIVGVVLVTGAAGVRLSAQLGGSRASMDRQNEAAQRNDFSYLASERQIARFVLHDLLVPVVGNEDYRIHTGVSFPYARRATRRFIEEFAENYRRGCGSEMVVTSLIRPRNSQPSNASERSVHPTGMAVDLRVPRDERCQLWMSTTLTAYERQDAVEATLERRPPHYHIAVLPRGYEAFLARRGKDTADMRPERLALERTVRGAAGETYQVRPGDNLSSIASRFDVSVSALRDLNNLSGSSIRAGQVLQVTKGEMD